MALSGPRQVVIQVRLQEHTIGGKRRDTGAQALRGIVPTPPQSGYNAAPEKDAIMALVGVARILDRKKAVRAQIRRERLARRIKQWPDDDPGMQRPALRCSRQPLEASPAKRPKEKGLGLVVGVVGEDQASTRLEPRGKRLIAHAPGRSLDSFAATCRYLDPDHVERNAELIREEPAMFLPLVRGFIETVVDMHRLQRTGQPVGLAGKGVEQSEGILTATETHEVLRGPGRQGQEPAGDNGRLQHGYPCGCPMALNRW